VIDAWLDLIHGTTCVGCPAPGRSLCAECLRRLPAQAVRVRPTPCPDGLAACFAAGEYDGVLRAMILAHKERAAFTLARPLGQLLAVAAGPCVDPRAATFFVPVPSRAGVVRSRGHDPMLRIARAAARHLRRPDQPVGVLRLARQHTPVADQSGLGAVQRAANLAGSMRVRPAAREALSRVRAPVSLLVCDDVLTTGSTAREAQRCLEDSGLRVRAVVTVAATRKRVGAGGQGR
jgi:predicted amidophosphoribosyltransferase